MGEQLDLENSKNRAEAWERDRYVEATPLPYADLPRYTNDDQRQTDLAAAERSNIARAAGELGLTTGEWQVKRAELGRSPNRGDIAK